LTEADIGVVEQGLPSPGATPFRRYVQQFALLIALGVMMTVVSSLSPNFLTSDNLLNVARQVSLLGILGAGMTVVIISGGIDLSVGGVVALGSTLCAGTVVATGGNLFLGVAVALATGVVVGIMNGIVIAKMHIQPFIVTLAAVSIARGIALIYTDARPISLLEYPRFAVFGQGYVGPIPVPIVLMLGVFGVTWLLLRMTKFGRYVFAIGGNEAATRIAGVNVDRYKICIYAFNGVLVGLTSLMFTSRLMSGTPTLGAGFELTAITMVILGGTSFTGGQGTVWGTLVGAALLGVLSNAMNLLGVSTYYQDLSVGGVILVAVIIDRLLRTRRE
jgi:ribose/xylose/arabinose/galactoside ABC-type transport system permease subunit